MFLTERMSNQSDEGCLEDKGVHSVIDDPSSNSMESLRSYLFPQCVLKVRPPLLARFRLFCF